MSDQIPETSDPETTSSEKIRYAVVTLGWFAQVGVLSAFANASRNSEGGGAGALRRPG